jgi:hypothetical protein
MQDDHLAAMVAEFPFIAVYIVEHYFGCHVAFWSLNIVSLVRSYSRFIMNVAARSK